MRYWHNWHNCLFYWSFIVISLILSSTVYAQLTHLHQVEYHTIDNQAQMIIHFDKPFTFKSQHPQPKQLTITFPETNLNQLTTTAHHHHGPLLPNVDFKQHNGSVNVHIHAQHAFSPQYKSTQSNNLIINFAHYRPHSHQQSKTRPAKIVIDPGHGGKDPGATGPIGVHEKNVALDISSQIKQDLAQHPTIKSYLTRHQDKFVSLRDRLNIARKHQADAFAAIHADAFYQASAHGCSVYALSQHGATSEAARWLAHSENYAILGGAEFHGHNHQLQSVLLNLSQKATIANSVQLGKTVLTQLSQTTDLHKHKVEQAPFVVLKSPDIPSILIETGFISNRQEEKRLNSTSYQHKVAHAIADGLMHYLYEHPPHNSLVARQQRGQLRAEVHQGDTLSDIAQQYFTSVHKLRQLNPNMNKTLHPGNKLAIPPASL